MDGHESYRSPVPGGTPARHTGPHLTRRGLVGAGAGLLAMVPLHVAGQSTPETQQPVATPADTSVIDRDALTRVSTALVGGGSLNDAALDTLGRLISADPGRVTAFDEVASAEDASADDALDAMSPDARSLVDDIVEFWYLGYFDGNPVENRADLYFSLPVWKTVPYVAQPTVCKAFGYWSMDISLD